MSRIDAGFGLVLFDERVSPDTLTAKGAAAAQSAYTESGPGPGHPVPVTVGSEWRAQVVGAQTVAIETVAIVGGYPGRSGASLLYRLATDSAASDWRGWNEPNLLTDWSAPSGAWGASAPFDQIDACALPSGVIVVTAVDVATRAALTWQYEPRTGVWTQVYDWTSGTRDGLRGPIGMAYDAREGRLILWDGMGSDGDASQTAWYSTDGGSTWAVYARGYLSGSTGTGVRLQVVIPSGDRPWLMLSTTSGLAGASSAIQWVSSDRGVTWTLQPNPGGMPGFANYAAEGPVGIAVVSRRSTGGGTILDVRVIPSADAWVGKVASPTASITSFGTTNSWVVADADGTLYLFSQGDTSYGEERLMRVHRSRDGGLTWTLYVHGALNCGDATHWFEPHSVIASGGRIYMAGTAIGSANTDGTVQMLIFGGWDQVCMGAGEDAEARQSHLRGGYGGWGVWDPAAAASTYIPIAAPNNAGWTSVGADTGTVSMTTEPGALVTTTAGQDKIWRSVAAGSLTYRACEVVVETRAGSADVATLTLANPGVGLYFELSNGTSNRLIQILVGTDGLEFYSPAVGVAVQASQALDTTAGKVYIRVALGVGWSSAWYRQTPTGPWTLWADNITVPDGGGSAVVDDNLTFGNFSGAAGISVWHMVGWTAGENGSGEATGDWRYGQTSPNDFDSTPADKVLGLQYGHTVPGKGASYPIPDLTAAGESIGGITATGGPALYGERVQHPVGYAQPIGAIYPADSPSPRRAWLATDDSAVRLVWDQGANQHSWWGGAVALAVLQGRCPQWVLESSSDGTTWTTLGTCDLTLASGLTWTRVGRSISPRSGTATIPRFIAEGELVGGHIDLDGDVRVIARNSQGYWTDAATVQAVRISVDGVTGAEAANGTAGKIMAPSGVLVVYRTAGADTPARFMRVTVAGSQTANGGLYGAGIVGIGRVVGVGAAPSWGWSSAQRLSRRTAEASDGVMSATELGPPRRAVTYDWPDGQMMGKLRLLATPADYVAASGGAPIGSAEDVSLALGAWVEHSMQSGAMPCMVLPTLPAATATILDPTLMVYGRLAGEITTTMRVGAEGTNEILMTGPLTLSEIR